MQCVVSLYLEIKQEVQETGEGPSGQSQSELAASTTEHMPAVSHGRQQKSGSRESKSHAKNNPKPAFKQRPPTLLQKVSQILTEFNHVHVLHAAIIDSSFVLFFSYLQMKFVTNGMLLCSASATL